MGHGCPRVRDREAGEWGDLGLGPHGGLGAWREQVCSLTAAAQGGAHGRSATHVEKRKAFSLSEQSSSLGLTDLSSHIFT